MQSEIAIKAPNVGMLLKISLGLIVLAMISSAFVYADTATVTVDGTSHDIVYVGNGVSVTGVEADLDFISLIFSVDVTDSPGVLSITLDRNFFDSVYQGDDEDFFVLADGVDISFDEEKTSVTRILTMELPLGTQDVEIIGSVFNKSPEEQPPTETPTETTTPEKEIPAPFVDPTKDPKYYVQRYLDEPSYKTWFEDNYPDYTFYEALGITKTQYDNLVKELSPEPTTPEKPTPEQKPGTACGPGTILKDGACVLDQRCGPGTVLKDDVCVVESTSQTTSDVKGMGIELVTALIAGFIIAGTVGLILALISRASKNKNN